MKMKKGFILIICVSALLLRSQPLRAQFGAGLAVSTFGAIDYYPSVAGNKAIENWGGFFYPEDGIALRANGCYALNSRMRLNLALEYFFPTEKKTWGSDSGGQGPRPVYDFYVNDPQLVLRADFQYSLKNDLIGSPFGIYALAGMAAGATYYDVRYSPQQTPYSDSITLVREQRQTYYGISFNLGIGFEVPLHHNYSAYLEFRACSGINNYITTDDYNHGRFLPHDFNPAYILATIGLRKDFKRKTLK